MGSAVVVAAAGDSDSDSDNTLRLLVGMIIK